MLTVPHSCRRCALSDVSLNDTEVELPAGQLVTLASQVPHDLSAKVDSVVLLVVAGGK